MWKKVFKISLILFVVLFLTVLTQVGGIFLLLFLVLWKRIVQFNFFRNKKKWPLRFYKTGGFLLFYLILSFSLVPLIAKQFGRVPLPVFSSETIKPLNILTVALNRHYVDEALYDVLQDVSTSMNEAYPGTIIAYLDANFPFINGFPLLPHLSHDDGEKLDLAFFYTDTESGKTLNNAAPSFIGYGVFEEPHNAEEDKPNFCAKHGYWQYSILGTLVPQWYKNAYTFDPKRTKKLVSLFSQSPAIGKIFIEPHLKERMNLHSDKVRYHGCGAVRHDDHIHVQLN